MQALTFHHRHHQSVAHHLQRVGAARGHLYVSVRAGRRARGHGGVHVAGLLLPALQRRAAGWPDVRLPQYPQLRPPAGGPIVGRDGIPPILARDVIPLN